MMYTDPQEKPTLAAEEGTTTTFPSIATLLRYAAQKTRELLPQLSLVIVILFVLQLPTGFFDADIVELDSFSTATGALWLVLILLASSIAGLFSIAVFHHIVQLLQDTPNATVKTSVYWLGRNLGTVILLMVLVFGISITGVFLLIIPALVFAVYNIFSYIVLIQERKYTAMGCIVRSTQLVHGAFWSLLGRTLGVLLVVAIVLAVVTSILNSLLTTVFAFLPVWFVETTAMAFGTIIQVIFMIVTVSILLRLYNARLAQIDEESTNLPTKRLRTTYWTAAVLGWLGFLSLTLGLFVIFASTILMAF